MKKINGVYHEDPVHIWFGLTYSSYLVLHRSLMEGMPYQWQDKMIALLNEMDDTYDNSKMPTNFMVKARGERNRFIVDPFSQYRHPPKLPYRKGKKP